MGAEMQAMNIIKRSGEEVRYDRSKIVNAVSKANVEVDPIRRLNPSQIEAVADNVEKQLRQYTHAANVEDIQDLVETGIMEMRGYEVAQAYMHYRDKRTALRRSNTTDRKILSLINRNNELVKQENANKNPTINSTQRDYIAGEVSRDLTRRLFLPEDIVKAHEEGIIHFHDADYFAMREHNCDLINLDDMLQNGTVISGTKIDKPHSFYTACNITTQIVAQVASNQYGGQSFSLYHVSKFVDVSRQSLRARTRADLESAGIAASDEQVNQIAERRLKKEIKSGIQTIQYQLITLMTCNGQAPFVTMFMYLDEAPEGQPRDDLALCIEEVLNQRIQGTKNAQGVWVTTTFPKLIYVLDEDNIEPGTPYYYLTDLSARCTAKRMVPDYISAKVMKQLKNGNVYTCMGCRSFLTDEPTITNPDGSHKFYGRFNQGVVTINLVDVACSSGGERRQILADPRRTPRALPPGAALPPRTPPRHTLRRRADSLAARGAGPAEARRNHRQAALRRLQHHLPRLRGALRNVPVHDGQIPHRSGGRALRAGRDAAAQRQVCRMAGGGKHRLLGLRDADGIHDL
jgi:anaerobic ribonucleoside-triphosphate reductase